MIALNRRTKIFMCKEATDMRASYDSLFGRVKMVLSKDPFSGHLFLFVNRTRTSCKCLYYLWYRIRNHLKEVRARNFFQY